MRRTMIKHTPTLFRITDLKWNIERWTAHSTLKMLVLYKIMQMVRFLKQHRPRGSPMVRGIQVLLLYGMTAIFQLREAFTQIGYKWIQENIEYLGTNRQQIKEILHRLSPTLRMAQERSSNFSKREEIHRFNSRFQKIEMAWWARYRISWGTRWITLGNVFRIRPSWKQDK